MAGDCRSDDGWPEGDRPNQQGHHRLSLPARGISADLGKKRRCRGALQAGRRHGRPGGRHRHPAGDARRLLRRARQRARRQRQFLPGGQGAALADQGLRYQGNQRPVAYARTARRGRALHDVVRRQDAVYRRGQDLCGCRQGGAVDQGRQRDAFRRDLDHPARLSGVRQNATGRLPLRPIQSKEENRMSAIAKVTVFAFAAGLAGAAHAAGDDWARVGEALGKPGTELPGGVYRVALPRTDIKATLDGVELKPGFALGGWLAFTKTGKDAMVMGDLVLAMDEVSPVMAKLLAGGIEVTALHNHLLRNQPFTMYMHVAGTGDPLKLAGALHAALAESKTPLAAVASGSSQPAAAPAAAPAPPAIDLDTAALDQLLGAKGSNNGGVYQYGIARAAPVKDGGMVVPPAMGSANAINFQPTGGGKAAITGDFVLIDKEGAPVMKTLRDSGIEVTALHNHMLGDQPHLFFMHFWANDDAKKLATGLKAALSHIAIAKG